MAGLALSSLMFTNCTLIHNEVGDARVALRAQKVYTAKISGDPQAESIIPKNRAQVMRVLGPPDKIGRLGNHRYAFGYEYINVTERQLGIGIPGFTFLKLAIGKAGAGRSAVIIEFSKNNEVLAAGAANWHEHVGFGANMQLFFSVTPTTDTGGIRERWATESWTTDLLYGSIGMVDLSHDPDAGDSGIRLSGMPKPDVQWPAERTGRR